MIKIICFELVAKRLIGPCVVVQMSSVFRSAFGAKTLYRIFIKLFLWFIEENYIAIVIVLSMFNFYLIYLLVTAYSILMDLN